MTKSNENLAWNARPGGLDHWVGNCKVAVVCSRFNETVTDRLLESCVAELRNCGVAQENIHVLRVAGALEIAQALQMVTGRVDAGIALGCVIRGETFHFEIVSLQSAAAISELALRAGVPIVNGILTLENETQAEARMGSAITVARIALEMIDLKKRNP